MSTKWLEAQELIANQCQRSNDGGCQARFTDEELRQARRAVERAVAALDHSEFPPDRVMGNEDGEITLYFFSTRKTPGGASARFASLTFSADEICLVLEDRTKVEDSSIEQIDDTSVSAAFLRARAWINAA